MKKTTLPFCLDRDEIRGHDVAHDVEGIVRLAKDAVIIRFSLNYATVGGAQVEDPDTPPELLAETLDRDVAADTQSVRIPLEEIDGMEMWGGVLRSPRLVIHVRETRSLERLPWSDGCSCMMRMRRADGQRLREWLVEAELRLGRAHTGTDIGFQESDPPTPPV